MLKSSAGKSTYKAIAIVLVLAALVLAVFSLYKFVFQSGPQSSMDEPLPHPEKNYLGRLKFDVDPKASIVSITPTGKLPADITVKTVGNAEWNESMGLLDFNVQLGWNRKDADLYNVRLSTVSSTNMNVRTLNSARCSGRWSECLPNFEPAIVYVSDNQTDPGGAGVSQKVCLNLKPPFCTVRYLNSIGAGCNSLVAHWSLQEESGAKYSFLADLWGDIHPNTPLTSDSFYDPETASIYLRTFKVSGATAEFPGEGDASNSMVPGEWFYVHYYIDSPGSNQALPFDQTPGVGDKHIEDTGNIAAWAQGRESAANYWAISEALWSIRFDPAVIEINSAGTNDPPGNGSLKFTTVQGTRLAVINDPNDLDDGIDVSSVGYLASNSIGVFSSISPRFSAKAGFFPDPCGTMPGNNCNAADGFSNIDWNVGYVALRVKPSAVVGQGSSIHISWDSRTAITAARTNGMPYNSGSWHLDVIPRSMKWPNWCEQTPRGFCLQGQYNSERTYICVQ